MSVASLGVSAGKSTVQIATGVSVPADKTLNTGSWFSQALPAECKYVRFSTDYNVYCQPGNAAEPTTDGVTYYAGITYQLECDIDSFSYLWMKRIPASATAFKMSFFTG